MTRLHPGMQREFDEIMEGIRGTAEETRVMAGLLLCARRVMETLPLGILVVDQASYLKALTVTLETALHFAYVHPEMVPLIVRATSKKAEEVVVKLGVPPAQSAAKTEEISRAMADAFLRAFQSAGVGARQEADDGAA